MQDTGNKFLLNRKITDELFHEDFPERYNLFIFVSQDEISFAVADRKSRTFVALESWSNTEADLFSETSLNSLREISTLIKGFEYSRIVCCTGFLNASLVPKPLFEPAAATDQFQFANKNLPGNKFMIDELNQLEAANIFTIPDYVYKTITSWFNNAEFHHSSTAVIEYLLTANRNLKEELITAIVHRNFIEIVVTKGRQLVLYNHFRYDTPEELVYYLLFVCEQLHLNPDHVLLKYTGEIQPSDAAFQLSTKYIRNCSLATRPEIHEYAAAFNQLPGQYHFNLFSEVICVS